MKGRIIAASHITRRFTHTGNTGIDNANGGRHA